MSMSSTVVQPQPLNDWPTARMSRRTRNRIVAGVVCVLCVGLLLFAGYLDPEPNSAGQQTDLSSFGYPGCGFRNTTGLPCITCGMTTTFSYMADGRIAMGFRTQPAGALLAILVAALAVISALAAVTGASLTPMTRRLWCGPVIVTGIAILLAAWTYNIAMTVG